LVTDVHYLTTSSGAAEFHEATLRVPARLPFQLVFRQERNRAFAVKPLDNVEFCLVDSLEMATAHLTTLRKLMGWRGAAKATLKVKAGRVFYFVRDGDSVLHTGWMTSSWCRYYRVGQGDVIVGPIWSAEAARSRGVGSFATQMAINAMIQRGRTVFFIDTENDNHPCLRLIDKCEFGYPIAAYLRG
jgi:hypothetical protein